MSQTHASSFSLFLLFEPTPKLHLPALPPQPQPPPPTITSPLRSVNTPQPALDRLSHKPVGASQHTRNTYAPLPAPQPAASQPTAPRRPPRPPRPRTPSTPYLPDNSHKPRPRRLPSTRSSLPPPTLPVGRRPLKFAATTQTRSLPSHLRRPLLPAHRRSSSSSPHRNTASLFLPECRQRPQTAPTPASATTSSSTAPSTSPPAPSPNLHAASPRPYPLPPQQPPASPKQPANSHLPARPRQQPQTDPPTPATHPHAAPPPSRTTTNRTKTRSRASTHQTRRSFAAHSFATSRHRQSSLIIIVAGFVAAAGQ